MTPARFWQLVDTLGGVADDESCARLDELLRGSGEGPALADLLDDAVDTLVSECLWPDEVRGSDTASWAAAAVVAAGREAYDAMRRREVDLDQWQWDESEALLAVGFDESGVDEGHGPQAGHGEPVSVLAADEAFVERRRRVEHLRLWLTVRPAVPAGEPTPDPSTHSPLTDGYRPVREAVA